MTSLADSITAYAAYLNARHPFDDPDEQVLFDEDRTKARREMEIVWLQASAKKQ